MCGIFLEILLENIEHPCCQDENLSKRLRSRGPDTRGDLIIYLGKDGFESAFDDHCNINSESKHSGIQLHFVGHVLQTQGSRLISQPLVHQDGVLMLNGDLYNCNKISADESDSTYLLNKFKSNVETDFVQRKQSMLNIIRELEGPFCIIYLDKISSQLYLTRDKIGRHSLLLNYNEQYIVISSVLGRQYKHTMEIPAANILSINLKDLSITVHDWKTHGSTRTFSNIKDYISNVIEIAGIKYQEEYSEECLPDEKDLILIEKINKIADTSKDGDSFMSTVLNLTEVNEIVNNIITVLTNSVNLRVNTQPFMCKHCKDNKCNKNSHSTVSILFSGGLDCSLLAALAAKALPEHLAIDLLNVAFENKNMKNFDVPDRLTARQTLDELRSLFPKRTWNLVESNVTKKELDKYQNEIIADLVFPLQSILDESLGSALWFAARGQSETNSSHSRIVLVGSGADELFGGYNRHRICFKRHGWAGLGNELKMDWKRISYRNLARDSRVIGDHGRQPRFPYLDENFLKYILQLQPWQRCIPNEFCKRGWGDKLFLRLAAYKVGLCKASLLEKRAIQFGSRIANKNENANDISPRLRVTHQ